MTTMTHAPKDQRRKVALDDGVAERVHAMQAALSSTDTPREALASALGLTSVPERGLTEAKLLSQLLRVGLKSVEERAAEQLYALAAEMEDADEAATSAELSRMALERHEDDQA